MVRYVPSRMYLPAGVAALALGIVSLWFAARWAPSYIAVVLFLASSALLLYLAFRPPVEISADGLIIGRRRIAWNTIRRVDRTGWISPLVVRLALEGEDSPLFLVYPGEPRSATRLLQALREHARWALIDGIPHWQFWGQDPPEERRILEPPKYRILRPEDEEEVERLYQRLKTVGHLDSSADES